jgi:sugar phosphate isomerase/epimerase
MKLSLSVRIAEAPTKDHMTIGFEPFAELAKRCGYKAICLRASAGGVQSPRSQLQAMRQLLDNLGLDVSMVTTDFDVPLNNEQGPNNLRDIEPHLDVAEQMRANLIRVCMKQAEDIAAAQRAADQARERGIRLAHQCHTNSLFETVDQILEVLQRICRDNFGLIYEPANLMLCGQPYGAETLRRLAPHLMNVYVQNHRLAADGPVRLPTRVRGEVGYHDIPLWHEYGVDFEEVFAGLRAIGYDGYVTVHQQFAKLMGPEEAAEQSYAFLSGLIQHAE